MMQWMAGSKEERRGDDNEATDDSYNRTQQRTIHTQRAEQHTTGDSYTTGDPYTTSNTQRQHTNKWWTVHKLLTVDELRGGGSNERIKGL
jgi:hypothetical protein